MTQLRLSTAPSPEVEVPANLGPTFFEVGWARKLDAPAADGASALPAQVQDTVRAALDARLTGEVALPDVVPDSSIELRFLGANGGLRLRKVVALAGPDTLRVLLDRTDVAVITAPEPQPQPLPPTVARNAYFVSVSADGVSFEGAQLQLAPIAVGGGGWKTLGLDRLFNSDQPLTTGVPFVAGVWTTPPGLAWAKVHLAVDGSFGAQFGQGAGDAWLWWLTGSVSAIGVVLDDLRTVRALRVGIPLPVTSWSAPSNGAPSRVPTNVTESEVANNPNIYTEDPGAFCQPFSNPERVLGERSFSVIFRVEQPVISAEATVKKDPLAVIGALATPVRDAVAMRLAPGAAAGGVASTAAVPARAVVLGEEVDAPLVRHELPTAYVDVVRTFARGRTDMDAAHPIQWDGDVSRYQATTVARGHILEFRMRWRSNGYSLGTVAKTLTLAPRQTRKIEKIEWRRSETARRTETTQLLDQVSDSVTRDRDYSDAVESNLSEWARGSSESTSAAASAGFGFVVPPFVVGGGGGLSHASSSSSQDGGRTVSAAEEQRLRDSIRRYGDSLRKLDSIVVNEVTQEETATGTTEVVRNPNYGHSLTVIYYQILRHLKIETGIGGVRECLFVPFAITPFTVARAYRWREAIGRGMRDPQYAPALKFLKDVRDGFQNSPVPPGRRSDQPVRFIYGSLYVRLAVERPRDKDDGSFDPVQWARLQPFVATPAMGIFATLKALAESERDALFQKQNAGPIAANWVDTLSFLVSGAPVPADFTLATRYQFGGVVRVDFTATVPTGVNLTREVLSKIQIVATKPLPPGSVANLQRLSFTYQTDTFQRTVSAAQGSEDMITVETGVPDAGAEVSTIPDEWERRNVRDEMKTAVQDLVDHLNEHVEYYTKLVLWNMDRDRLFMMIDGFYVPGTNQVSIASVVERDPIAIVGNAIVFRVSAGSFLGLGDIKTPPQLLNYYVSNQPPTEPMLVSLPTDGLYAQTVMDPCSGLEEHSGSTDWVLNDPDPALIDIAPELLASRRADPQPTAPAPMPQTLINLQNAPDAPAPAGLAGALSAVTSPNAFRDMAGLAGTQANAAAAFQTAASLAQNFGNQAATLKLAELAKDAHSTQTADQKLATVQRAVDKGLVSQEVGAQHASSILDSLHAESPSSPGNQRAEAVTRAVTSASTSGQGFSVQHSTAEGTTTVTQSPAPTAPATAPSNEPAGDGAAADGTDDGEAPGIDSPAYADGNGDAVAQLGDFDVRGQTNPQLVFNSPEHMDLGNGLQFMIDSWARRGLIAGGAFVEDLDANGAPQAVELWKVYLPDLTKPTAPYDAIPSGARAHWHWIVPDAHVDGQGTRWTASSLLAAIKAGQALTLSIGDIVMMSGDLVGDFAEFKQGVSGWRAGPVNVARGADQREPFAMTGVRLSQFPSDGKLGKKHDADLLERNLNDYDTLKQEVLSSDPVWTATRALVTYLQKVRGPSGFSEMLVLSRIMRKEKVSIPNIGALTPWITQQDLVDVYRAAQAVGADLDNHMNSDVFQFIVSNGYYAQLALENKAHFCPYNWVKFEQAQAAALAMVDAQVPINVASPNAVAPIPADAVAQVAYGLHFLSDAFSGGHMRVPRAELGRDGSFLSGVMHDFDGKMGLAVENGLGDRWCAFGDGNLDNQSSAQRDRLAAMTALSDGRREANREHAQAAMGAAMKQLHYQAQKHYGDAQNAAWFQPILDGVRGTSSGLQFDNLVEGNPGDGSSRDAWIAMDAATKLTYMRKHQPRPLAVSMAWRSGAGNFPPLVELDANQKPVIATQGAYRWVKHKMKLNKDRVLRYEGDSGLELDFTTYFQLATNFPSGALSWSGTREKWLQVLLQTMPEQ